MDSEQALAAVRAVFPNAATSTLEVGDEPLAARAASVAAYRSPRLDLWTHTVPYEPHLELTHYDCGNGNTETCVVVRDADFVKRPRSKRPPSGHRETRDTMSPDDLERSTRRAKRRVRLACKCIGADRLLTVTSRKYLVTESDFWAAFGEFRRLWKKRFHRQLLCVVVPELHPTSNDHYHGHCAILGRVDANAVRTVWRQALRNTFHAARADHSPGNIDLRYRKNSNVNALARYLSKYLTKEMDRGLVHSKRYEVSRGIEPRKVKLYAPLGLTDLDIIRKVQELSGGELCRNPKWEVYGGFDCLLIETGPVTVVPKPG